MLSTKRSWRRSRPGAFDHLWEKYEAGFSVFFFFPGNVIGSLAMLLYKQL